MVISGENKPTRDEIIKMSDIQISRDDFSSDHQPDTTMDIDGIIKAKDFKADIEVSEQPYKGCEGKAIDELKKIYKNGTIAVLGDENFRRYATDFCDGELRSEDVTKRIFGELAEFCRLDEYQKEAMNKGFIDFYRKHRDQYDLIADNDYFLLRPTKK